MPDRTRPDALRVRLHGDPAVELPGGRTVALERRAAALLALAALEPGIGRLRVALLLWPDSADPRRNLRQQLLRFRQLFGHALVTGDAGLSLADDVRLADATPAPLLGGHDYADCEDFSTWLAAQRERAHRGWLDAAQQRLLASEAAGDLDAALEAARALLTLDPHAERHHRELMRLHYLRGDMASGLKAFRRLSEMLATEFDSRPSAESEALARVMRDPPHPPAPAPAIEPVRPPRPSLPVTLKRPPRLAGRSAERAAVLQHWAEGRAVLLEGEAGLGKSRLMAELLQGASGALHAAGRPGDAGAPFATLARWLRPLMNDGPEGLDPAAREALAHLVPLATANATPPAGANDSDGLAMAAAPTPLRPGAMAGAVSELLRLRGVQWLALDDLHFADDATLELVAGLAAQDDPPRRWLLAGRPAELAAAGHRLRDALAELQRLGLVRLTPLDEEAVASVVDSLAIPGLHGAALAGPLQRHTGGNPLFVLETLKHGLTDGSLARGELPRPGSVGSLIERRLQRLSEPALTLARVAAIAGVDFSIELAEAAIGVRAVQLASAWGELQDAQVLREESFAHDLVSDAVLRSVPPVVARRVHAQCAAWLAARDVEPARVARHWQLGGRPAEAGLAYVAAAKRAELASRGPEEATLYGHAAEAFAAAGLTHQRFDALCDRVAALMGASFGDLALQEARRLTAAADTDTQRVRAHRELAGLLTERGQLEEAIEAGLGGLALARRLDDPGAQVRIVCHMATALCRLGRADEAHALLLPLRTWVDTQDNDRLRMLWHGDWAATLGHMGRLREAEVAYQPALAAVRRIGWRAGEGRLLQNLSVTLRQMGQFDRALALSREGRALTTDATSDLQIAALVLARDEAEAGFYAAALAALEAALPQFEAAGAAFWSQACRMVLAKLWLHLGQYARALPLLQNEPGGLPPWLGADRQLLAMELAQAMGQPLPADAAVLATALAAVDAQRGPGMQVRALRALAPQEIASQAPALAATLAAKERFGALLTLQVHVARAALAEGRHEAAAAAARSALALAAEGFAPEAMYRPEMHLVAWQALSRAGAGHEAAAAVEAGSAWIRGHALPQVPAPFLDSFLHRNAINRELLAAAAAAARTPA